MNMDTGEYFDILNWFITKSSHPGYADLPVPKCFPSPCFVADESTQNNTDEPSDEAVEKSFQGGTYYYSTAQEPIDKAGMYDDNEAFATAMLSQSSLTLLTVGGKYKNAKELRIEDVLPFALSYGTGGSKCPRQTSISEDQCLQRYCQLAMRQFMTGDVCLVLNQMFGRIHSYQSCVMPCGSQVNGVSLGEKLARFTSKDIPTDGLINAATDIFFKNNTASCRALGQTPEAVKAAHKGYFSYMEHFGLSSIFLTVTLDDQRDFCIRSCVHSDRNVSVRCFSF